MQFIVILRHFAHNVLAQRPFPCLGLRYYLAVSSFPAPRTLGVAELVKQDGDCSVRHVENLPKDTGRNALVVKTHVAPGEILFLSSLYLRERILDAQRRQDCSSIFTQGLVNRFSRRFVPQLFSIHFHFIRECGMKPTDKSNRQDIRYQLNVKRSFVMFGQQHSSG